MPAWLRPHLLLVAIAGALLAALLVPQPGRALAGVPAIPALIVGVFLCQGAGVDARRFRAIGAYAGLLLWGAVIAFVAAPALALATVSALGWTGEERVGLLLMTCMGPTLVSGVVIAERAGGEREAATLLTVGLNLAAIASIPPTLAWALGDAVTVDASTLLLRLVLLVLLPAIAGQALRVAAPARVAAWQGALKLIPVALLGCILYLALSARVEQLRAVEAAPLVAVVLPCLGIHLSLAALAYLGARRGLGSTGPRATAVAVVTSQKTLPVAIAVWATGFAATHPGALFVPIVFHLTQLATDGLLAGWWARRAGGAE